MNYWLGISKNDAGNWKCDDGRSIIDSVGVYPWWPNEPNGGNSENCASFENKNNEEYMIVDISCSDTESYICKLK